MVSADVEAWLRETRTWADAAIEGALERHDCGPPAHAEALRYALFAGGKRLRPALVRLACRHFGGDDERCAAPAAAVEMVHTYSLVHDDLPCMDDDDLRRGRPTTHRVYGQAAAVLVGDALQALAFEHLATRGGARGAEMVRVLAAAAGPGGMVGGQVLDLAGRGDADPGEVEVIHRHKTAALMAAAVDLGSLAADAPAEARAAMHAFGIALGRCFQAVDDVLDVTGDARTLGKTPGKDAAENKATLVAALGLEGARAEAERLAREARGHAHAAGCAEGDLALALIDYLLGRTS